MSAASTMMSEIPKSSTRRDRDCVQHSNRALGICLISEEFPPDTGGGGIGTYVYNLAHGLAQLGHRVHVIARGWGKDIVQELNGIRVYRVSIPEPSWRRGTHWVNLRFHETREVVLWNMRVSQMIGAIVRSQR